MRSVAVPRCVRAFGTAFAEAAANHGLESRSAACSKAVYLLRSEELSRQYAHAFVEWEGSADQKFWDQFSGDGIASTPEW